MNRHGVPDPDPGPGAVEEPFVDSGPTDGPPEALVLDIGGDVGALVLYAEESCLGLEIDLTPVGVPRSHHTHTMIRRRRAVDREFIAGVYPSLQAGTYTVWGVDDRPLGEVTIDGGRVSEFRAGSCRTSPDDGAPTPGAHGHDHAGHDHAGHDHAGHDHPGHDHPGHDHPDHAQP
jgi:hypothetical protein